MTTLKGVLKLTVEYLGVVNLFTPLSFVANVHNQFKACIVRLCNRIAKLVVPEPAEAFTELIVGEIAVDRECSDSPLVVNPVSHSMSP